MARKLTREQAEELEKCRNDVVYFITTYGKLKHTSRGEIPWDKPYPYQVDLWRELQAGKDVVVNKTRQIGCSWAVAAYCVWFICFHPDMELLFLSETEKKAIRLLNNAKFFFDHLPNFLKPRVFSRSQTRFVVEFVSRRNDQIVRKQSSIDSLTTTGRSGASYSAAIILLDEAAHMPNAEETWTAVKPAAAHGGQTIVVSTPGGTANFFFRLWTEATMEHADSKFVAIAAYWKECGLTQEWFERATDGLTETQILQEFELRFLTSGSPFFDVGHLAACYKPISEYPVLRDVRGQRIDVRTEMSFTGVDTAEGNRTNAGVPDYTSIITLNEFGVEIASWHSNKTNLEDVAGYTMVLDNGRQVEVDGIVTEHHRKYPGGMSVERFGPGDTVYFRHSPKAPIDDVSYVVGRRTTGGRMGAQSKQRIMNSLRLAVAGRQIIIRDEFTYNCMLAFEDKGNSKYEAAEGFFDDPVVALALAYAELWRYGGYMLDLDETNFGGRRMVAQEKAGDLDPKELADVIPVGEIVSGPVISFDAEDSWRKSDEIDRWRSM